jgi:hypothetical protein
MSGNYNNKDTSYQRTGLEFQGQGIPGTGEFQGQYTYLGCYAVNGLNQYTSTGPASFSYDANACPEPSRRGNLIADGTNGYVYDAENRLVGASGARSPKNEPLLT